MADPATDMRMFENRLATFQESDHPAKKIQTSQGKGVPKSWPHETPTARDLAYAGFYFAPTSNSQDNVKCFHCEVKLDGWEIDDEPIREHVAHSAECAWAVTTSVTLGNEDRDPMSEKLLTARLETFGSSWPYEKKRGWKPKAKKLAEAGWSMDPSLRAEDGTICFYCQVSLDGWEPKDDPIEEHRKRQQDCIFFELLDRYAATRPKKGRGRNSTASKTSRLSTQSIQSTFSEAPSFMSLGEAAPILEPDSSIGTITSMTSTAKGKKKVPAAKKGGRSKKKVADDSEMTGMETAMANLDETLAPSQTLLQGTQEEPQVEMKEEPVKKATRGKGKGKKVAAKPADETDDQSQLQSELVASVMEPEPKKPVTRAKRGKKRTSDGEEKPTELTETVAGSQPAQSVEPSEEAPIKAKKGKATRGKKAKVVEEEQPAKEQTIEEPVQVDEAEVEVKEEAPKTKRGRKPKATKPAKQPSPEPELEVAPEPEAEVDIPMEDESANYVVHPDAEESEANYVLHPGEEESEANYVVHDESSANFVVHDQTPEPEEFEPTPTPQKAPVARDPTPEQAVSTHTTPQSIRSQRSSDAENHPPSSNARASKRISAAAAPVIPPPAPSPPVEIAAPAPLQAPRLSPVKTTRVPLAAQTPNRSPSKHSPTKLGYLKARTPWTATDIETIFFPAEGQENAGTGMAKKIADLGAQLTSPEKKMSVEEWINFQARKGEERLKEECERLVWLFEQEGTRAMGVLEGVEVRTET
ncbi:Bir1-like protein [Elsinoe fawcettii]|nr:Bir1-like protein [Elsinoe fawcettii]